MQDEILGHPKDKNILVNFYHNIERNKQPLIN